MPEPPALGPAEFEPPFFLRVRSGHVGAGLFTLAPSHLALPLSFYWPANRVQERVDGLGLVFRPVRVWLLLCRRIK